MNAIIIWCMASQILTPDRVTSVRKHSRPVRWFSKRWQKFCPKWFRRDGSLLSHLKNLHWAQLGLPHGIHSYLQFTLINELYKHPSPQHCTYTASCGWTYLLRWTLLYLLLLLLRNHINTKIIHNMISGLYYCGLLSGTTWHLKWFS